VPRVLILAYHFPPMGGGGVQRNAKFARYLPQLGWQPLVVTGPGRSLDRWSPTDETLLADVPAQVEVHRLEGAEPPPATRRRAAVERRLMRPSAVARWWMDGALRLGARVGGTADVLYASLVPYETADPAAKLARQLNIPWVADLQDPWALDEMWLYPSGVHRRRDMARMRSVLATAAAIVMNTPEARKRLLDHFPELGARVVVSIPNGFDTSDFAAPPPAPRTDGKFRIVHTGALHTDQGLRLKRTRLARRVLGGTYAPVNVLTRSHVQLLAAIERLATAAPELRSNIEVVLAGRSTPVDRETSRQHPYVSMPGYLSHAETIALMRGADLLFLPMHDLEPPRRAGLVPGKTYEYLAAGRPILAAVPDGDARELLEEAGNALICWPADTDAIADAIATQIAMRRAGLPMPAPAPEVLARYERRRQTADLADVLSRVTAARRKGAGTSATPAPAMAAGA
jgi:glycosyltransferase involved in cell wall biosynthesis